MFCIGYLTCNIYSASGIEIKICNTYNIYDVKKTAELERGIKIKTKFKTKDDKLKVKAYIEDMLAYLDNILFQKL